MTEDLAHFSPITRHPSASLYDRLFVSALPEVAAVAAHKNVHLPEGEAENVLRYALKDISRKTLKQALQKHDKACWAVSFAVDHALDVLAMKRLIMISKTVCKVPLPDDNALVAEAEASLKRRFANDTTPTCAIWRDPIEEVAHYVRGSVADHDKPAVRLPTDYASQIEVHGLAFSRQSHGTRT